VSCGVYLDDEIVMRHEFEKVINLCEREVAISICDPKGCGKTYTLTLLFALCVHTSTRCILLTLNSFKRINEGYFKMFLTDEKEDAEVLITALQQEGDETIIFVDLSRCKTNVAESSSKMKDFFDNIISLKAYQRMVISVSSGVSVTTSYETIGQNCMQFVSKFSSLVIEGFSEVEASQYVQKKHSTLNFKDIKYLTGNNPYLLSQIPNTEINEQHSIL